MEVIQFRQSNNDFPLTVALGKKVPSWGLSRWNKSGLRFVPLDDEGFVLRGDRHRLLYKGRRRSHRFTILGDSAFEYDCILQREPDSNVISLLMEGAEKFDFYRQPDFVPDVFLKGSYAVYKKETFIGEGTGKLCHIHRPEIIDARGRRCWGALSIEGNKLLITIPERWLSEAAYPVVVDPTIGTNTIGSQTTGKDPNNNSNDRPWLDSEFTVNKYQVPQNGNGLCTAYLYCCNNNTSAYVTPFLYTNVNNKPFKIKSKNEKDIDARFSSPGWKNNTFNLDGDIVAGEYVWFGIHASLFTTRFDYGGECYKGWFNFDGYEEYEEAEAFPPYIHLPDPYITYCTIKWSMYFTYTAVTSQNFVRTLTQGVLCTDNRKLSVSFKRNLTQSVQANTTIARFQDISRKFKDMVTELDSFSFNVYFKRLINNVSTITEAIGQSRFLFRRLFNNAGNDSDLKTEKTIFRTLSDTLKAESSVSRGMLLFVRIFTGVFVRDYVLKRFLVARSELTIKSCISREIVLESKIY